MPRCPLRFALITLLACGCQHRLPSPCPTLPAVRPPSPAIPSSPADTERKLDIQLTPLPDRGALAVAITATGPSADLGRWCLPKAASWTLDAVDSEGEQLDASKTNQGLSIPRVQSTTVRVRYVVTESSAPPGALPTLEVTPDRFQASGDSILMMPCSFDSHSITANLRFDLEAIQIHDRKGGASSFGPGDRTVSTSPRELRVSTFAAGAIGTALFDAVEGRDEAAWFGFTTFDPRPIAADIAALRTAITKSLGPPSFEAESQLFITDARAPGEFRVRRRGRGVTAHVGAGQPWSSDLRIAVAAAVVHSWIGTQVWIGPSQEKQGEGYWFSEGLTRHLARDLLFRYGWITPEEMAGEVHGLMTTLATSPLRDQTNAQLASRAEDPEALRVLVARGALHAGRMDHLLRHKSKGRKGLPDLVRSLIAKAAGSGGVLAEAAWVEALSTTLESDTNAVFREDILDGRPSEPPATMLGPCFDRVQRNYVRFELGFDNEASWTSGSKKAMGVRAEGPAARAGLREGDKIIDASLPRGNPDELVRLTIERVGERKTVEYLPRGAARSWFGWRRNRVPEAGCVGP